MTKYTVVVSKSAEKELSKLPVSAILQLRETIFKLADDPRPTYRLQKTERVQENLYRVRTGEYRIIYGVEDSILTVEVLRVGDRKDVYGR
ncbi:MAG: type II toxin-antitoxin system RelE/ParE family toxin [Rudanella sp.]|nr:type II toxin-antitoxin system RelE/ParE family toxin [Rudanella sp.]